MFPTLLRFGGIHIYSYGLMLFIAFIVGIWQVERRAKKFGVKPQQITDLALVVLVASIVGSRLFYVAFHWQEFEHDLVGIIAFWRGGLAGLMFYGGFLSGITAGFVYGGLVQKLPKFKMMDAIAPAIVLGEGFTRIGCFLNGCCFGKPTSGPLGMVFPANSPAGYVFEGQPIHPTQLYSALAGFALFFIATRLERGHLKEGVLASLLLILYSVFRFLIDFVRYYENSANLWGNQIVALGLAVVGIALLVVFQRRRSSGRESAEAGSVP